jgi:Na+/H+ antiporter NhaD/arsenite permease-like protein
MTSIAVLIFVFVLITLRKISGIKIDIWVAMLLGAILDIVLFQTSIKDAFKYIDWNVTSLNAPEVSYISLAAINYSRKSYNTWGCKQCYNNSKC